MAPGDSIVCEFMLGALLFKHASYILDREIGEAGTAGKRNIEQMDEYIRCMVVNVFIKIILGEECWDTTGAEYAYDAIEGMLEGSTNRHGNNICDSVDFTITKVVGRNLAHQMRMWWQKQQIAPATGQDVGILNSKCKGWREKGTEGGGTHTLNELKPQLKEQLHDRLHKSQATIETTVETKLTEIKRDGKPPATPATAATQPPGPPVPPGTTPADAGGGHQKGQKPSAPSAGETTPGTSQDDTGEAACKENLGKGPQTLGSVIISPACTSGEALGKKPGLTDKANSQPTTHDNDKDSTENTPTPPVADPAAGKPSASTPTAPSGDSGAKGTNGASGSPAQDGEPGPSGPTGEKGEAGNSSGHAVVDGGNDDPPPLNPPKPKPNPNPNQSGSTAVSSGEQSSGGAASGASGGEGKAGGAGGPKDGGPGAGVGAGTGGSSGGGAGGGAGGSGTEVGTPSVAPGLRWEDVKWYTPAIIPAVVGIGLIAFFLWKYFAYLAKRRRTYRTVRDVPSPPLDEEILDHLQRGELPPPDYGYTLIRDRQPSSISGSARPPRVHKGTIIELHLEVLNECEVTEWQNVKDDYLHILVEEFMWGNNGHSSSLDAPTTNEGLSGTNVASTVDPSTDSDASPPHEDDPWSRMQTIPLATDRSPPNEDDPDPWRCMETIQLEPDPCPHNEDDPWSFDNAASVVLHCCASSNQMFDKTSKS
ncbi:hypothetical protein AK88_05413 [Plasmodium fragile]|uniref:Schizont-infected cell agglutination C-terminal domain-containing protein n=1 Tax=Plasmodium fragile TaxID=5857 RepID=A0A0D9QD66_PLAFR|nr:uncharacterized protein AK88_05413 [Plasmodium fragile]KJP84958.1 hypothetical protein AK88_05413 [Plasmodium fragile]